MGQYYKPLIIHQDNHVDVLDGWDFNNGQKLMEHSWIGNTFVNAVYILIYHNSCKVAWMGDYAESEAEEEIIKQAGGQESFTEYFNIAWRNKKAKHLKPRNFKEYGIDTFLTADTIGTYLINHTKKIYVSLEEYINENKFTGTEKEHWTWCINPLPLLTASSNGCGGSYYGTNMQDLGTWAFNEIEYSDKEPSTYKKVSYSFREE